MSLDPTPLGNLRPRDAFDGHQTLVEGSAEHQAYREALAAREAVDRRAALDAQRRLVDEQRAREQRVAEEARAAQVRLAEQQAQAAVVERARLEAERREQASREEEARQREDAQRRLAEAARAQDSRIVAGRVPKGEEVAVRLVDGLRTDRVSVEDSFTVTTAEDIVVDGRVLVPAGATIRGVVAAVQPATRTNRKAKLDLTFDLLTIGSRSFSMRGRANMSGRGLKGDGVKAGVGAGIGAIVGGILGGGKGAALGGAIGGGGAIAATEGQEINLPSGSQFRVKFESAVELR